MEPISSFLSTPETGVLQFGAARMALVDIESGFWGIRRQIESMIGRQLTNSVLQQAGANGGASFARSFGQAADPQEELNHFKACVAAYQAAGFGRFEFQEIDWPIGRIILHGSNTFESWMMQQQKQSPQEPICAYTAGVLVGFINATCNRTDIVCIEHACQGQGAAECVFELLPSRSLERESFVAYSPDPGISRQLNLLEILFERMPMGIAIFDREIRLQRCNPTWAEYIDRYTPAELGEVRPGAQLFELAPGLDESMAPLFERVLAGETITVNGFRSQSGDFVSYWDSVYSPILEQDKVVGILDVTADATERMLAYQEMEQRVTERTREIQQKRQVAESLQGIIKTINTSETLQAVLEYIVRIANQLMGSGASVLHKVEIESDFVSIQASIGLPEEIQDIVGFPLFSSSRTDQKIMDRKPAWISDFNAYPNSGDSTIDPVVRRWRAATNEHFRAFLAVPLEVRNEIYGSIAFYFRHPREFQPEEIELAESFADQAALAIENARLRDQVQENAITSERNRLARELHDAVTQTLFSASLIAEVLPMIWDKDAHEGKKRLEELRQLTRGALSEMRTLLLEMRPGTLEETNLQELLKHLVNAFIGRTRIQVETHFEGSCPLPVDLKIALYRITQEALNNISKHATASQVQLNVCIEPGSVYIYIQDDGIGFDLHSDQTGMGLKIMHERAEAAGIDLRINSKMGTGTQVTLKKEWTSNAEEE